MSSQNHQSSSANEVTAPNSDTRSQMEASSAKKAWREKEKAKYEKKIAAKKAAGEPNDDHVFKWRGPKGGRYRGYGKTYKKGSKAENPPQPIPSHTVNTPGKFLADCPYEIISQILTGFSEKEINAITKINSHHYKSVNPILYETNIRSGQSSALFWAAAKGSENTIRRMKAFGANLHLTMVLGNEVHLSDLGNGFRGNALHIAIAYGHMSIVMLLIREGVCLAQNWVCRFEGQDSTCLRIAISRHNPSLGMFLLKKLGGKTLSEYMLWDILTLRDRELDISFEEQTLWLQIILPNLRYKFNGGSALHAVTMWGEWGHFERVPILLEILYNYGLDVNSRLSNTKTTALHLASIVGCEELVKYLLSHGADVNALDVYLRTPLHYAVSMNTILWPYHPQHPRAKEGINEVRWRGSVGIVKMLLERGADPDAKSEDCGWAPSEGLTPSEIAAGNTDRWFRAAFKEGLVGKKKEGKKDGTRTSTGVEQRQEEDESTETKSIQESVVSLFG